MQPQKPLPEVYWVPPNSRTLKEFPRYWARYSEWKKATTNQENGKTSPHPTNGKPQPTRRHHREENIIDKSNNISARRLGWQHKTHKQGHGNGHYRGAAEDKNK
mgnify:FL=1